MPTSNYIKLLGPNHIFYLSILFLLGLLIYKKQDWIRQYRTYISWTLVLISFLQQAILYGSYLKEGFPLDEALPLHISRINTLLGLVYLISRSRKLIPFLTYFSFFAWLSFIYPSRIEPISHIRGLSFLVNHLITVYLPFYAWIAYQDRIRPGDKTKAFLGFLAYLLVAFLVNLAVDGNYFYMKHIPIFPQMPLWLYLLITILFVYTVFTAIETLVVKDK